MNKFLDLDLLPRLLDNQHAERLVVAVVSHGIVLGHLWRCLMKRFAIHSVRVGNGVTLGGGRSGTSLEYLGGWSNTGYLEVDIKKLVEAPEIVESARTTAKVEIVDVLSMTIKSVEVPTMLYGWTLTIKAVNNTEHLRKLKRTRGGVGSSAYDDTQKTLEGFFKRAKT